MKKENTQAQTQTNTLTPDHSIPQFSSAKSTSEFYTSVI